MPIYDYYCEECKFEKEEIHKMNESPEIICPNCGSKMKIALQATNFKIKGWFTSKTGYAKNKKYMEAVERKKKKKESSDTNVKVKIDGKEIE